MFCKSCGEKLPDDANFCMKCGARCLTESSSKDMHQKKSQSDERTVFESTVKQNVEGWTEFKLTITNKKITVARGKDIRHTPLRSITGVNMWEDESWFTRFRVLTINSVNGIVGVFRFRNDNEAVRVAELINSVILDCDSGAL